MSAAAGHTWDEASSPEAVGLARRFEAAWRDSSGTRPDPDLYLQALDEHSRDGARLAILRADLGLRWEAGEPVRAESYRLRYPDLSDDMLVALIYEEYCLREEHTGPPDPQEFYARFPDLAPKLRRVLDIHGLVGSGASTSFQISGPDPASSPFPDASQTIAGFHLVEELGRGSFARVFRAEERQLADRPVALKVARKGSREPQTLARLQHTHIVPVHSYRTDPATGLHLLCMPYFGRVTLARLLEDPKVQQARTGAEVFLALDALEPSAPAPGAARKLLSPLPFSSLLAWWGARLAEALQHAHDRGVLHRDIKPSNVLVTSDGIPMLLDFNLAQTRLTDPDDLADESLGGTLAYMAPEHLDALAQGCPLRVDARADLYALGVVLFEAMGTRPFPAKPPSGCRSLVEALEKTADERRRSIPRLREIHPETPPAFEAVVRKALEPDPDLRYQTAAELAADLQAVFDGGPLKSAWEPLPSRACRFLLRNRIRLAVAVPALAAAAALLYADYADVQSRFSEIRRRNDIRQQITQGVSQEHLGHYDLAASHYETAVRLAESSLNHPSEPPRLPSETLDGLEQNARKHLREVHDAMRVRASVNRLFERSGALRFSLLGLGASGDLDSRQLKSALEPFFVFQNPHWTSSPDLQVWLDDHERSRLVNEVEHLLFFWAVASSALASDTHTQPLQQAIDLCDRALVFSKSKAPWIALRNRCQTRLTSPQTPPSAIPAPAPQSLDSSWTAFQWALIRLADARDRPADAVPYLERAVQLDPARFWPHFCLAFCDQELGRDTQALAHCDTAIALDKSSRFAHYTRGMILWHRGLWQDSLDELNQALALASEQKEPFPEALLERGIVRHQIGDLSAARLDFHALLASSGPSSPLGRAARLNLAALNDDAGLVERARSQYETLLHEPPSSLTASALLGHAQLALRTGHPALAQHDLETLAASNPRNAEVQALRARAFLALHRNQEAVHAARSAYQFDPLPSRARLLLRAQIALGDLQNSRLERPSTLLDLPGPRQPLLADLRKLANRLAARPPSDDASALNLCVVLAALRDRSALTLADQIIERGPQSDRSYRIRARLRLWLGDPSGAMNDVQTGLNLEPDDPRLLELQSQLLWNQGARPLALATLDRALTLGGTPTALKTRASMRLDLNQPALAIDDWTAQLSLDPDDPQSYLGRARAFARARLWNHACADLEHAAAESPDRPHLLLRVALTYTSCLPSCPNRLPRVLALLPRAARHLIPTLITPLH